MRNKESYHSTVKSMTPSPPPLTLNAQKYPSACSRNTLRSAPVFGCFLITKLPGRMCLPCPSGCNRMFLFLLANLPWYSASHGEEEAKQRPDDHADDADHLLSCDRLRLDCMMDSVEVHRIRRFVHDIATLDDDNKITWTEGQKVRCSCVVRCKIENRAETR